MNDKKHVTVDTSLLWILQIIFIVLKCTNLIDWPWKVVLIPLWIDLGIIALALLVILVFAICRAFKDK